ncbi:MAG TPA: hypothetical protein PLI95_31310, partial [Polyangiaceae bacterium]|nr:hypothetical protein [Polyangiaceae bacterium]
MAPALGGCALGKGFALEAACSELDGAGSGSRAMTGADSEGLDAGVLAPGSALDSGGSDAATGVDGLWSRMKTAATLTVTNEVSPASVPQTQVGVCAAAATGTPVFPRATAPPVVTIGAGFAAIVPVASGRGGGLD